MCRLERWIIHAGNHRTCFSFGIILVVIHLVLVAERVYRYRHSGAWIVIARSSGQCLHFDCALVLLLTLRRCFTWLRSKGMDWLLPLDRHIYFHKMIGWLICVFSVVHTVAHIINYGIMSRGNAAKMKDYLFDKTAGWIPGIVTPSGFAILFLLFIMGLFSHRLVRKSGRFELFYWTHMLCLPFFLLMILHAGNVWKWLIVPLCLFGAEIGYRIGFICCSERGRTQVTSLQLLPNQVVRLKIERPPDFEFHAGDYVYVNIPQVARFEWHPFTISSAPEHEDYMTLHVRVAGGWTGRLYSMCQEDAERLERKQSRHRIVQQQISDKLSPFQSMPMHLEKSVAVTGQDNPAFHEQESTSLPVISSEVAISIVSTTENIRNTFKDLLPTEMPIMLDGPYSGSAMRAWNCRHALFIAGGIGVTPFASLLQSLVSRYQSAMNECPHCHQSCCTNVPSSLGKLRHVDFMWVNRDLLSFQWFLELLLDLDKEQSVRGSVMENFLDIQLFQTGTKTMPDPHEPCASCRESLAVTPQIQTDLLDANAIVPSAPASQVTGRCPYCTIRQVKHLLNYGRPIWDEVFRDVALRSGGQVTVFYCGPASMARVVMAQCKKFGFTFTKEIS
ncbi:NADPH oxidase 5-like [Daphnia carinata]|uniref:NADPH oxidase 5-like n=1 Tax=Daphnia carinata TaxID=120202 RepID=UPI00257C1D1A|nr:NADPH oxidase 5-like [Daphnia carinata]XP_059350636.1 NADPH oxidase 5-like [Daphnia carinata]